MFSAAPGFDGNRLKVNLKLSVSRMNLLKNKNANTIKNQRREICNLLRDEKVDSARIKVEHIISEEKTNQAYEVLEIFLELLHARVQVLTLTKEVPPDMFQAIFSVIYAAPRLNVKELLQVKHDLTIKLGKEQVKEAMEDSDCHVHPLILEKLSIRPPPVEVVFKCLEEIAKEHGLDWKAADHMPQVMPSLLNPSAATSLLPPAPIPYLPLTVSPAIPPSSQTGPLLSLPSTPTTLPPVVLPPPHSPAPVHSTSTPPATPIPQPSTVPANPSAPAAPITATLTKSPGGKIIIHNMAPDFAPPASPAALSTSSPPLIHTASLPPANTSSAQEAPTASNTRPLDEDEILRQKVNSLSNNSLAGLFPSAPGKKNEIKEKDDVPEVDELEARLAALRRK